MWFGHRQSELNAVVTDDDNLVFVARSSIKACFLSAMTV